MADDGSEFGSTGLMARDPRFGDVRIGSIPLDEGQLATSVSTVKVIDGTWTGDVLFNSNATFASIDEVFAVALHEAGHVFGLDHNDDPGSPMFEHGLPNSLTPTANDIAELHSVFGPRSLDVYELAEEYEPFHELEQFKLNDGPKGSAPTVAFADIGVLDVDEFELEVPDGYSGALTVEVVTSGISLLTPRLLVTTESGMPIGASMSYSPGTDLSLTVNQVAGMEHYRFIVDASGSDVYAVGGYSLLIWFHDGLNQVDPASIQDFIRYPTRHIESDDLAEYFEDGLVFFANDDDGMNDGVGLEHELETTPGFAEGNSLPDPGQH